MNHSRNNIEDDLHSHGEFLPWNNPNSLITYDAYLKTVFYLDAVVKPVIFCVGVPTNILSSMVFRRQGLADRMNLCLFVHVLVDMTYVSYSMAFTLAFWIRILEPALGEELYMKTQYYAISVNYGLREASACISVVIAVERCVCVVFPLRANSLMRTRTMGILLVAIVISMQLAFVTTPIKKYVYPVYDNSTGGTRWAVETSAVWQKSETLVLYDKVEDTVMMVAFPLFTFALVAGSTAITVVKLRVSISWRETTASIKHDTLGHQVALTKMLVLVSCVFVACKVPWVVITLTRIFHPDFSLSGRQSNTYQVLEVVAHYLIYIHSTVNFFVYYSRSFRFKALSRALCGCSQKPTTQSRGACGNK